MAHFIGYVQGNQSEESRIGTKNSGMRVQAQGWDLGAQIVIHHDPTLGDCVTIFLTHGSNNAGHAQCLGRYRKCSDGTFERIGG